MSNIDPRLIPPEQALPSPLVDYDGEGLGDQMLSPTVRIPLEMMVEWDLDWEEYHRRFDEAHGGHPVQIDEWLVWEDGWKCDAYDPGGTEVAPPEDRGALNALLRGYYQSRLAVTDAYLQSLVNRTETIRSIQAHKSLPLRTRSVSWTRDDSGEYAPKLSQGELDLTAAERATEDLRQEVAYCNAKLKELEDG
jgi:hypothetical protein